MNTQGIYDKFRVQRTDGKDAEGKKHEGCEYFVLDLTHDEHAIPALEAYAQSCGGELAADLRRKLMEMRMARVSPTAFDSDPRGWSR